MPRRTFQAGGIKKRSIKQTLVSNFRPCGLYQDWQFTLVSNFRPRGLYQDWQFTLVSNFRPRGLYQDWQFTLWKCKLSILIKYAQISIKQFEHTSLRKNILDIYKKKKQLIRTYFTLLHVQMYMFSDFFSYMSWNKLQSMHYINKLLYMH